MSLVLCRRNVGEDLGGVSVDVEFTQKVQTAIKFSKTVLEGSSPSTPAKKEPIL